MDDTRNAGLIILIVVTAVLAALALALVTPTLLALDAEAQESPPYPGYLHIPVTCNLHTYHVNNDAESTYIRIVYYGIPDDPACAPRGICITTGRPAAELQARGPWSLPMYQHMGSYSRRNISVQVTNTNGRQPDVTVTSAAPCHHLTALPMIEVNP